MVSPRRRRRQALIGTLLALAVIGGVVLTLYLVDRPCSWGGSCPSNGGPALALSIPKESSEGSEFSYNFTVTAAAGPWTLRSLTVTVVSPHGELLDLSESSLAVHNGSASVDSYSFAHSSWTFGGAELLYVGEVLTLVSPVTLNGNTFSVAVTGGPSAAVSIP